jgi:hypothetical protein
VPSIKVKANFYHFNTGFTESGFLLSLKDVSAGVGASALLDVAAVTDFSSGDGSKYLVLDF